MKINKVLVAVDESEGARRALELAEALAAPDPDMHLDLVYVVPIPLLDESQTASFEDILDMMISDGEDVLTKMEESLGEDVAARTETLLMTGVNPATEIIKLTEQRDYDMVVIGNRGLVGLMRMISPHLGLPTSPTPFASGISPTLCGFAKCSMTFALYMLAIITALPSG